MNPAGHSQATPQSRTHPGRAHEVAGVKPNYAVSSPLKQQTSGNLNDMVAVLGSEETLIYLQRTVGNFAVASLMPRPPEAPPGLSRRTGRSSTVQRQDSSMPGSSGPVGAAAQATSGSAVWNAPEDFGAISDCGAARTALGRLLTDIAGFATTGIDEVTTGYNQQQQSLTNAQTALAQSGPLQQSDADALNALSGPFTLFYGGSTALIKSKVVAALRQVKPLNEDTDAITGELADALHQLYVQPEKERIEELKDALEKVKDLAEKGKKAADWASAAAGDLETAEKIFEVGEKLEKTADFIGNINTAIDAGKALFTIVQNQYGKDKGSDIGTVDSLEAGLDLTTMAGSSFMEAVPLFGQYWNGYVMPVAKLCLTQVRHLIEIKDQINLDRMNQLVNWTPTEGGWEASPEPPELDPIVYTSLPGGRPVFEYVYLTKYGSQPAMTSEVEQYFIENKDKFSWGEDEAIKVQSGATWYKPWTWGSKKAPGLAEWLTAHIDTVWASLYGKAGMFRP